MTPPNGEKPGVKPAVDSTNPDAPKPPEAEAKAAEVKGGTSADRREHADDVSKGEVKPAEGAEDLPDNEWSQAYYNLKEQLTANPAMQGPLSTLALAVLRLAAKYSNNADLMPGRFQEKIWSSPDYKDKVLIKDNIAKVLEPKDTKKEEDMAAALKTQAENEAKSGRRLGRERASTKFVTNVLWGIDDINDASTLGASLVHTNRSGVPLYAFDTLDNVKKNPVKGTLIVFVPEMTTGVNLVAFGDYDKGNFKYYDVKTGKVENFTLDPNDPKCPVKQLGLLTILVPNIAAYKAAPETPDAPPVAAEVKLTPVEAVRKFVTDTGAKNKSVADSIAQYKISPVPWDVSKIKSDAADNIAFIEKMTQDLRPTVDSLNVEQFQIKETEAKQKLDVSTEADKLVLQQALAKATEDLKQAKQVQVYWKEVQALLAAAKANKEEADLLK